MHIIDTGKNSADENMQLDAQLLQEIETLPKAALHFYEWAAPSITYGHFSKPYQFLNGERLQERGFQLAKRPTGGGIIFHSFDFAFSVLLASSHPLFSLNTLDNYALINNVISRTVQEFLPNPHSLELLSCEQESASCKTETKGFCMAKPTVFDVVSQGRKIVGGAQRRTKAGLLHQASIALTLPPDEFLSAILLPGSGIGEAIKNNSFPILDAPSTETKKLEVIRILKERLTMAFSSALTY